MNDERVQILKDSETGGAFNVWFPNGGVVSRDNFRPIRDCNGRVNFWHWGGSASYVEYIIINDAPKEEVKVDEARFVSVDDSETEGAKEIRFPNGACLPRDVFIPKRDNEGEVLYWFHLGLDGIQYQIFND